MTKYNTITMVKLPRPSKVLNGIKAILKINGQVVSTQDLTYSTNHNNLEPAVRDFLDLLAKTGNSEAADHLANNEPWSSWASGVLNIKGEVGADQLNKMRGQFEHNHTDPTFRTPIISGKDR